MSGKFHVVVELIEPRLSSRGVERRSLAAEPPIPLVVLDALRCGTARWVFDPGRKTLRVDGGSTSRRRPRLIVVDSEGFGPTSELLASLEPAKGIARAFVAPPRQVYARRAVGPRSPTSQGGGPARGWCADAIGWTRARSEDLLPDASNQVIAVLDSGVDIEHPGIKPRLGAHENTGVGGGRSDPVGHGTHVAGIALGHMRTSEGLSGISDAKLLSLRCLEPYDPGAYYRALAEAIDRATVINLSLGGQEDPVEADFVEESLAAGIPVVAAMGNEHEEGNGKSFPASLEGVIAVGAVDEGRARAEFSNTGQHIDLVAPGVDIWSSVPTYASTMAKGTNFESWDGTSMATPFVSGTVALLRALRPTWTPTQIKAALRTRLCHGQKAWSTEFGSGFLDLHGTLAKVALPLGR